MIAPTFESLATKYAKPNRITFAKVDVDHQREIAQQYGVRAMPTFVILHNGSVIETIKGANPPALTAAVEKAVKLATASGGEGIAFSTPGRTLGDSTAGSGNSGSGAGLGRRPAGSPIQGSAWDLNRLINRLVAFFGLYFTSLFSVRSLSLSLSLHNTSSPSNTTSLTPIGLRKPLGSTCTCRAPPSTRGARRSAGAQRPREGAAPAGHHAAQHRRSQLFGH